MPLAFTTGTSSHPKNTLRKRKFEIKILLLLYVLIPGVMLSSLETINPWLSACDLKQQDSSDLKGSCSATTLISAAGTTPPPDVELLCPKECQPNETKTNSSCLAYLDETRKNAICNFNLGNGIEWLKSFLGTIRLRHCCEYKIIESLSGSLLERVLRGKDECFGIIDSLVEVDNLAARVTCEFSEILSRYDCGQPYSVKFSCNDCLEAYRRWVCSTLVPYYNESVRIRPCRSVCQAVEQKCPYFLPENKAPALPTQYAGEPTFLCMDPNIPETGEQQKRSLYPDEKTCCVKICGSLKDGLCVERGSKCKSEELVPYEEALDQTVECAAGESFGSRMPSLECTASEPYSSPHKLGSGVARTVPGPALTLLSAFTSRAHGRGPERLTAVFLIFFCCLLPAWLGQILACLWLVSAFLPRPRTLLTRFNAETKLFFHFVKSSNLIFNYFKFYNKKWQYYFILISVNLLFVSFTNNLEPLTTPLCLINGFAIGEKTRRARRYYYFYYNCNYYYFYRKHYHTILWNIAQNSNCYVSYSSTFATRRHYERKTFCLVIIIEPESGNYLISLKNENSLTINRIKICSIYNKIIFTKNYSSRDVMDTVKGSDPSVGFRRERTKTKAVAVDTVVAQSDPSARGPGPNSERKSGGLGPVIVRTRVAFPSSDPKCEFQTFLEAS